MLSKYLHYIIDFIYPNVCLICNKRIEIDYGRTKYKQYAARYCCPKCNSNLIFAPNNDVILQQLVSTFKDNLAISNAVALFSNSKDVPAINLIYGLKYRGFTNIGIEYGRWLANILIQNGLTNYDYIVPVPLHKVKIKERGYNQSDFIAKGISQILDIPVLSDVLVRTKYTQSQTLLSAKQRLSNLSGCFDVANKRKVRRKSFLLVDDVLTTGATFNNSSSALINCSAMQMDVIALLKS